MNIKRKQTKRKKNHTKPIETQKDILSQTEKDSYSIQEDHHYGRNSSERINLCFHNKQHQVQSGCKVEGRTYQIFKCFKKSVGM